MKEMDDTRISLAIKTKLAEMEKNDEKDNDSGAEFSPEDEITDFEDFVVMTPKRRTKPNVRTMQSVAGKCKKSKEIPTPNLKKKDSWDQGNLDLPVEGGEKKLANKRCYVEL